MHQHSETPETDESAEKLRALSAFIGTGETSVTEPVDSTLEILYSLMESGDADALAFLEANEGLCLSEYGEERILAITSKTRINAEAALESRYGIKLRRE